MTVPSSVCTTDTEYRPTVTVPREHVPRAIQHGMELWWDGSTPTKRLDEREGSDQFTRFVNARLEGKLSEVAFMVLLERDFNVRSSVDWRIYGDYEVTDNGDLQYLLDSDDTRHELGVDFDIKKTKPWNQWLAIREEIFEKIDEDAPVVLTKHRIESDLDVSAWRDAGDWDSVDQDESFRTRLLEFAEREFPLEVEFVGTAYPDEFEEYFHKGDRLYDPDSGTQIGPPLKRPNHAIHVTNLHNSPQRWNRVVAELIGDAGIEWSPIPVIDER